MAMGDAEQIKILIVDDEPVNLRVFEMTLKGQYEIITATDGREAMLKVQEARPDLVLLDIMMPVMNGYEVCEAIKADQELAAIPVIFVTALDKMLDESKGLALGAIDYIIKPVNPALLRLRVKNHLELKFQRDQLRKQRDLLARQKEDLEETLTRVKKLEGIISICMYCKKIRNEALDWQQIELYISSHSDALFSHGICPECFNSGKWK